MPSTLSLRRYGVALAATALAALLTLLLRRYLAETPYALFGAAIAVTAWYGGLGPGLLATALTALAGSSIFPELLVSHSIIGERVPGIAIVSFVLAGGFIAIVIALLRAARLRAETEQRRSAFLADASTELARSLDYSVTLQEVAQLAVPSIADWCAVYVLDEAGQIRLAAVTSTKPATEALIRDLARRYPIVALLATPPRDTMRTGAPQLIPDVSDALLQSMAPDLESLRMLRAIATRSIVAVPLVARGQTLGSVALGTTELGRRYGPADLSLATELANQAALAIDNARLYREARTAVQRREEALALLDTILSSAPTGLAFLSREFRFVRLNDALAEMIGAPRQEILGQTVADMLPKLWPTLGPMLRGVLETGMPAVNLEVSGETHAAPGVRRSWLVSYYPVRVNQTETLGIGVVVLEITERKRAEEERERLLERLGAEQSWLRTVIDRSPVGIILIEDGAEQRVVANQRAQELVGHPILPRGGTTQYTPDIHYSNGAACAYDKLPAVRALTGVTVEPEEFVLYQPSGRQVPILVTAAPIRDTDGDILGAVVVFEDISPLKELERLREEWTSIVAHDLRQPVTIISGYTDRLRRQMMRQAPLAEQETSVEHVRVAASNLNRMVTDLLDISRIEARRLTLERQKVDLPALVRGVVERSATITAGHPVRVEIEGKPPSLELDPARIEQLLGNLLSNAAKYGYPNTEIVVKVKPQDGHVELAVTNRGVGISREDLAQLFTRFFRTRIARERGITGVGLGLSITKGLVEAHGGKIWAESVPGETTTFYVTLPILQDTTERAL